MRFDTGGTESPFWVVWNERGGNPTVKHPTAESARAEAERLARKSPGARFHVLVVCGTCSVNDVVWSQPDYDEIPF